MTFVVLTLGFLAVRGDDQLAKDILAAHEKHREQMRRDGAPPEHVAGYETALNYFRDIVG